MTLQQETAIQVLRKKNVEELQQVLMSTSILANQAAAKLNEEVLPANLEVQRKLANRNLWTLGAYTLFTLISVILTVAYHDTETPTLMKREIDSLSSMNKTLQRIADSLAVRPTSTVVKLVQLPAVVKKR